MRMCLAAVAALLSFANPAASADLGGKPYRPPAPIADPIEPAFKWSGFYLGAHGGIITDGGSVFTYTEAGNFEPANRPRPTDMQDEFLYGLHGGYLHQYRSGIVVGAEGSVTLGGEGSLLENPPPVGNDYLTTSEMGPTWALTGRLGYAWDRFMVYAKAGYAWTDVDFSARFFNKDGPGGTNGTQVKISNNFSLDGPVYGLGAELALHRNVTLGVEWQRMDFGTSDVVTLTTTNSGILTEKLKASHEVDSVMGRLNFKF